MRWMLPFILGSWAGIAWLYVVMQVLPQHEVTVALEACFTETEPHEVTRLAWDIWATNPRKYPINAPLHIQANMTPMGAMARLCMWEQLDPKGFDKIVRGQG